MGEHKAAGVKPQVKHSGFLKNISPEPKYHCFLGGVYACIEGIADMGADTPILLYTRERRRPKKGRPSSVSSAVFMSLVQKNNLAPSDAPTRRPSDPIRREHIRNKI